MAENQNIKRRIAKIERALGADKGACFRFPLPEGGFIEVPGCRTLLDVLALAGIGSQKEKMDESERK